MVAKTAELPNIRKLFIPDEGKVIIDCDLARADAQVVAWDAGDDVLKQMFREGADIHTENAKTIFGPSAGKPERQKAKAGVHAVNYGVKGRTLAAALGVTVAEAEHFIDTWMAAHPPIKKWHERIENDLHTTRSIRNVFGYRRYYFDRLDNLLSQALAWIPQSTVGLVTNFGLLNIYKNLPEVDLLLQVHDSLVMQCDRDKIAELAPKILEQMSVIVPYEDPLIIPVGFDWSEKSWGDVQKTVVVDGTFYWADDDDNPTEPVQWPEAA